MRYGAANSRRLLVRAVKALDEFKDAVTVIGAHAVHLWVERVWGPRGAGCDPAPARGEQLGRPLRPRRDHRGHRRLARQVRACRR
ncbi:MAG: hypothetical protein LBH76_03405, partial [Propionibacteriaceae bacterium]|nr:hypothetical protein [Propionibacteriaceae bacterium]